ncbi:T9SS type A sorting domain-containing protein [Parabacteroides bouchesdurhonensis]|uniref:type IX secretion system anionic LPS delivery protein PorZ n=1 Tax=Parabacteroides bouchesdurhonensis TaxID=1936995 RepID=UPI000C850CEA|nr:T9SS type A sorting domain-containing protein [Parabacteroides bouchesdurhonensis]
MKRLYIILLFIFVIANTVFSDNSSSDRWKTYLSYYNTRIVEKAADKVFVVAEGDLPYNIKKDEVKPQGSLYSYTKEDNSIKEYNKLTGLNDSQISFIKYNTNTKSLLIIYNNWNIDIIDNNIVTNLPYLYNNTNITDKDVNSVLLYNEYAYISTNFGIMVVNMKKKEITDTYNLSVITTSCIINNNKIYASTSDGILEASLNDNLLDKNNWKEYFINTSLFNNKDINTLLLFQGKICFFVKNNGIYYEDNNTIIPIITNTTISSVKLIANKLACICSNQFYIFSDLDKYDQVNNISINDISSADKTDSYWIANGTSGLKYITKNTSGAYSVNSDPIIINSPKYNNSYRVLCNNSKVYVIPGGKSSNNNPLGYQGEIMVYDYDKWSIISPKTGMRNFTSIAIDPKNDENIFVTAYNNGAALFAGSDFYKYDTSNSTIESAISVPSSKAYMNIDGATFDKYGNIWMNNSEANTPIKVMDTDGKWHSIACPPLYNQYTLNSILITSTDKKWFNIPRVNPKIVVLDNNRTIDDSDDTYMEYTNFIDQDGNNFSPNSYNCMAEDKNNQVWIGTSKGAIYITNPDKAAASVVRCIRIKLTNENDEPYYFLDNIKVNCITVDGGNQKWIGTDGNGVYVLSADNQEIVHYFNTSNSLLISDVIYSIDINDETGEVFMGTDKGLVSYKGEATKGKENYSDVYAYPNPVRPDFNDKVTITGLMDNSNIKITDINGNILYQTKSIGGQATWNCKNKSGSRVSTGIYLVLISTNEGSESVVTKIAVIK